LLFFSLPRLRISIARLIGVGFGFQQQFESIDWGQSWLDKRVYCLKMRFDLRHDNAHYRVSPSLAMQKTGQWYCLIQVREFAAVFSFVFDMC
jgi:hypothetical protein